MTGSTRTTGTIVMAVYKPRPDLLTRQVDSIRHQMLTDWRCLIGLDGADAEARTLLSSLTKDDARFTVVEFPDNVGVYRHFERLVEQVPDEVPWVALSDQDDYWYPQKLAHLVPVLQGRTTAATCQARVVSDDGTVHGIALRRPGGLVDTLLRNQVTGGFSVFRRDVISHALPFPEGTKVAIHDHWLAAVASAMGRVHYDEAVLMDYVQHGANAIGEDRPTPWRQLIRNAVKAGGLRAYSDDFAVQVWGWPVTMSQALLQRFPHHPDRRTLLDLAEGRLTPRLLRIISRNIAQRRLRGRAVIGLGAAALRNRQARPAHGGRPL